MAIPIIPHRSSRLVAIASLVVLACAAYAESWRGELQSGGEILVDPESHRALHLQGERSRPLWDGVHRLRDGSTVIVRDGVAVPTEAMVRAWSGDPSASSPSAQLWCERLVRKACGADDACAGAPSCDAARQLLGFATDERLAIEEPAAVFESARQCLEAMHNDFFSACAAP